jgi:formyl-CoA transferase
MIALWMREKTGEGAFVSSSLLANGLWANGVGAQAALLGGFLPQRPPRERPRNALTNSYQTADQRWVQLSIVREERDWPKLCRLIERSELLIDPRFETTEKRRAASADLVALLDPVLASKPWAWWREQCDAAGIPIGLIGRLQDLPEDIQARSSGAVVPSLSPGMPETLAVPFQLDRVPLGPRVAAPALGEHASAILTQAGYSADQISRLKSQGAFGLAETSST